MHAAERDLLRSSQRGAFAKLLGDLAQDAAMATAAKAQAITAHYAAKVAALDPALSPAARAAALAQLKSEEAAELAVMLLEENRRAAQLRQARTASLTSTHRVATHGLAGRQRAERTVMAVAVRQRFATWRRSTRSWTSVRALATRIRMR